MVDLIKEYENKKFILKEETYNIIGACMEVHKHVGRGMLEIIYKEALEIELKNKAIPYEREKKFEIIYKNVLLHHCFYSDFIAYNKVIVEIKAVQKGFAEEHEKQLINYLAVSGCKVGLLINFGMKTLEYKRIVL